MFRLMLFSMLLLAPAASVSAVSAQAAPLPRVMSLNLCADVYLMAFADKRQVLALTPQSRDANLSAFHMQAHAYPVSDGQIESIAALKPDLVIVSSYSDPLRNRLIDRLNIKVLVMDAADNFAAAQAEIRALGEAIGRAREAQTYADTLRRTLAAIQPVPHAPRLLALQRRNLTVGKGHILDEIITLAGASNIGRRGAGGAMKTVSLENALAAKADYILLTERSARPDSRGMEFLTHPALRAQYPPHKTLHINNNLLVCAGATTARAVAKLVEQLNN